MATMLERIQAMLRGDAPPPPVAGLVGFELVAVAPGSAVFEMEAGPQHANPMGTLHGGILCDLADAAMGVAYASTLGDGESFTTLELKINFLRPFWSGRLVVTAHTVRAGRTIGLVECDVPDVDGKLVARAMSTCMTLRGESSEGR